MSAVAGSIAELAVIEEKQQGSGCLSETAWEGVVGVVCPVCMSCRMAADSALKSFVTRIVTHCLMQTALQVCVWLIDMQSHVSEMVIQ